MAPGALLLFFAVILLGFIFTGVVGMIKDRRDYNRAHPLTRPRRPPYRRPNQN